MVYEENPMDGQSAPRPGVALVMSLLRLRGGDEQHPAFHRVSVAPNTTCPRSLLCAPELGTNTGGCGQHEHVHHQVGNRAHARDHGAGPSHQAERAVRPHVQPGVREVVFVVVGVQGRIEDDFSGVVHVESASRWIVLAVTNAPPPGI